MTTKFEYATKRSKNSKVVEYKTTVKKEKPKYTLEAGNTIRLETSTNVYRYNRDKKELQIFRRESSSLVKGFAYGTVHLKTIKNVSLNKGDLSRFV